MVAPNPHIVRCFKHGNVLSESCVLDRCPECEREKISKEPWLKEFLEEFDKPPLEE